MNYSNWFEVSSTQDLHPIIDAWAHSIDLALSSFTTVSSVNAQVEGVRNLHV